MKKNIIVLFGGCSPEYSVSLESATAVIKHIDKSKFIAIPVGITKNGDWFYFSGDIEKIAEDTWHSSKYSAPALLSPNPSTKELLILNGERIQRVLIDGIFPVLHGKNGEDGTIQGMCELAKIPVIGCGSLSSALCMDKDIAHKLVSLEGVDVPKSFIVERPWEQSSIKDKAANIGYPLFVKPVKAGSSYGISKVTEASRLADAVSEAFIYDQAVIVEECIDGFEVGCAVMGDAELTIGEVDEIELAEGFFDFTEKYNLITSKIHVPARITKSKSDEIKNTARVIYKTLDCSGFARVDMFLTPEGKIFFNEVNTIPGFTPHSRFPNMMKAIGIYFEEVISKAIEMAVRV